MRIYLVRREKDGFICGCFDSHQKAVKYIDDAKGFIITELEVE